MNKKDGYNLKLFQEQYLQFNVFLNFLSLKIIVNLFKKHFIFIINIDKIIVVHMIFKNRQEQRK